MWRFHGDFHWPVSSRVERTAIAIEGHDFVCAGHLSSHRELLKARQRNHSYFFQKHSRIPSRFKCMHRRDGEGFPFTSHSMRLCVLPRASAFSEDDMRHSLVCAPARLTIFGLKPLSCGNLGLAPAAYNAGPRGIRIGWRGRANCPRRTQHYVKTIAGRPSENWKAGGAVTPLENVPRQAPCQEAAGVVASSAPQREQPVTRIRTAPARAKTPVHRGARRERGSTQLAAASKKRHQKVRLSQR